MMPVIVTGACDCDCAWQLGGPSVPVRLGRRDTLSSKAALSRGLPDAPDNFTQVLKTFTDVGLDLVDVVALSGTS